MKLICLDAEFADANEILELAVYDYEENQVYESLFRPERVKEWRNSQRIHHISPQMVKNKPTFAQCRADVQQLIDSTDYIVGFAVDNDVRMLERSGIERIDERTVVDVRDIYWHCIAKHNGIGLNSVPGLASCAGELGIAFDEENKEHSAGGDTLVTLRCLKAMIRKDAPADEEEALRTLIADTDADKREYRRENAKGFIHLLKGTRGYTLKTSTHERLSRNDVVATVAVEHRDRAEVDLLMHFAKKTLRGEHRIFDLRERDIAYFKAYTNTYDEENADIYRSYIKRF